MALDVESETIVIYVVVREISKITIYFSQTA